MSVRVTELAFFFMFPFCLWLTRSATIKFLIVNDERETVWTGSREGLLSFNSEESQLRPTCKLF
jgi:hypothetical protein